MRTSPLKVLISIEMIGKDLSKLEVKSQRNLVKEYQSYL